MSGFASWSFPKLSLRELPSLNSPLFYFESKTCKPQSVSGGKILVFIKEAAGRHTGMKELTINDYL